MKSATPREGALNNRPTLIIDLETNGLLDTLTKVHSLVLRDTKTGECWSYTDNDYKARAGNIADGIRHARTAGTLVAHNGIKFDEPALDKVYPGTISDLTEAGVVWRDTIVLASLLWPEIRNADFAATKKTGSSFPKRLIGSYSLEAFGYRMGQRKGSFKGPWDTWTKEMQEYCEQDTLVTAWLWDRIMARAPSPESVEIEHGFQRIIWQQEQNGFPFNERNASALYAQLAGRREALEKELVALFKPKWRGGDIQVPTKTINYKNKPGRTAGAEFTPVELVTFNPGSRDHIARWLIDDRGWKPQKFGKDGKPAVDETILAAMPWPEAKTLHEYFLMDKRCGQIAEGDQAWLKLCKAGKIHGRVKTNGAATARVTHNKPNMSAVPKVGSAYGAECRALFEPFPGDVLVGVDAASAQLRCLGHYTYPFDGGSIARAVVDGKSADSTDIHSLNAVALGLDPKKIYDADGKPSTGRDRAKRFIYAFCFGCRAPMAASILGCSQAEAKVKLAQYVVKMPSLGSLLEALVGKRDPSNWRLLKKGVIQTRGYLIGMDGRQLHTRSEHSVLAFLLQAAEAVMMKKANVLFWKRLREMNIESMVKQLGFFHDEVQLSCKPGVAEVAGKLFADCITEAGVLLKFKCPLAGEYKVGGNWRDTH